MISYINEVHEKQANDSLLMVVFTGRSRTTNSENNDYEHSGCGGGELMDEMNLGRVFLFQK